MSHFTVMVVGDDVDRALAPFHEFECTGRNDKYVLEIDTTEEDREEYKTHTTRRFKDPEGNFHDPYDRKFMRDPTPEEFAQIGTNLCGSGDVNGHRYYKEDWNDGLGYRPHVHVLPEGWEDLWVPTPQVMSFRDFIEYWHDRKPVLEGEQPDTVKDGDHTYGYLVVDKDGNVVKSVDRTNPREGVFSWRNAEGREIARTIGTDTPPTSPEELKPYQVAGARWDWYQVGGRWNGFFKLKRGRPGQLGTVGLQRMDPAYQPPDADHVDQARKGDIDVEGMREDAAREAGERYDKVVAVIGGEPSWESWEDVLKRFGENTQEARDFYWSQPHLEALKSSDLHYFDYDEFLKSRDQFMADAAKSAFRTFAILKDGVWYERGRMIWFAMTVDEKNTDTWGDLFNSLVDSIPDNEMLTVVDCHI